MSGSVTVYGGQTTSGLIDVISVQGSFGSANSAIQSLLESVAGSVTTQGTNFENLDVAGLSGSQTVTVGSSSTGLVEFTNVNSTNGSVNTTSANINAVVPSAYNTLIVQAPGAETITGSGASEQLAIFSGQSSVNFNTGGGSGTVVAGGGGDLIVATGSNYSIDGASSGNDTINAVGANSTVNTFGSGNATGNAIGSSLMPSNVVGLSAQAELVNSNGTDDLIETYSGTATVNVGNSADVLINGGADTIYATSSSQAVNAFFNLFGGTMDFINQSTMAATVSGAVPGASGGSATCDGGVGGGVYIGGTAGNNSLVGGSGAVTLIGAGSNNFLSAAGFGDSATTANVLSAGTGGATMVAALGTGFNTFYGGTGTDSIVANGSGQQDFFVGATGSEDIVGSTVAGSVNNYYFLQDDTGAGADIISNFRVGIDHILINIIGSHSGVSVAGYSAIPGSSGSTEIFLSDATTIRLVGVNANQLNASIIGGTSI